MRLGYNTNGLAHHNLFQAVELLAELGYESVALTLDHRALNPFEPNHLGDLRRMRDLLHRLNMNCVIETGARFLLDPRLKHEPTLVSPQPEGRARRVDFLCRAIDAAAVLQADCVSLWSGVTHDQAAGEELFDRLVTGLQPVLKYAGEKRVMIGFEPEPGMVIDTMNTYARLCERIASPYFGLTLDVGHLHCLGETPIAEVIRHWKTRLVNVHIEDMRAGVHEHLMFGEGEMDFPPILAALAEVGYDLGIHVELSRHSHAGPATARAARDFLRPLLP